MEKIKFYTKSSISSTPELKMVIDVSGNVGIGESNPTKKLEVVGDISFNGNLYQNGSPFQSGTLVNETTDISTNSLEVVGDISFNGNLYQNGSPFQSGTLVNETTDISTNSLSAQTIISANNLTSDILKVGNASINNVLYSIQTKYVTNDGANSHNAGSSVDVYGDKMIVGAHLGGVNNNGAAYIFDLSSGTQLHKLTANTGSNVYDSLGRQTIGIYGNYAIAGARSLNNNTGSAYIFDVTSGTKLHTLTDNSGSANYYFGEYVSIYGNNAIVGARKGIGAHIFNVTSGNLVRKLFPAPSSAHPFPTMLPNGQDSRIVDIYDNYAIVGDSRAAAYIFNVSTGAQLHELIPNGWVNGGQFGNSVAINNTYAIVGEPYGNTDYEGNAYVFDVSTGSQLHKLEASDAASHDYFGTSVAIHGNYVIVGASSKNVGTGSVYIFNASSGTQTHTITASDAASHDFFGSSVSISNNYAIVGAKYANNSNGNSSGAVYTFSSQVYTGNLLDVSDNVYIQSNIGVHVSSPQYTLHVDGTIAGSSAFVNTSDNRVKHNEQYVTDALSIISKLTPKHYFKTKNTLYDSSHNFILDISGNPLDDNKQSLILNKDYTIETGIIAQEIQTIPEMKFVVHETIPLGVDYNSIHCTHIAATKELYDVVQTQQQEINNLKQETQTLKQELQNIKQHLGI